MNHQKNVKELLEALKYVKNIMDSDFYNTNFDDMYDHISTIISKYEKSTSAYFVE